MNHNTQALQRDPHYQPTRTWPRANLYCYAEFRGWLRDTGCGPTLIRRHTAAARWAFCLLDNKPYWTIDLDADLVTVKTYLAEHFTSPETRKVHRLGLSKLATFLRLKCHRPAAAPTLRWETYLGALPAALGQDVRAYITQRQARWPDATRHDRTRDTLGPLARALRGMAAVAAEGLSTWGELTPKRWWAYTDARLRVGVSTRTLNIEWWSVVAFLHYLVDLGQPVCARMFQVEPFPPTMHLPKDVPPEALRQLLQAVRNQAARLPINQGRMGVLDTAWVLLMLHGGLRTGEVRRLQPGDVDWESRIIRVAQSKGLKDRRVPMSAAVAEALRTYLAIRGPADLLPADLFVFNHRPLSRGYCRHRLDYYETQTGVHITPHQLRHSCATLLLNAGMPIVTVKLILGHKYVDTTLGYARVYDGTLAADYTRAMRSIEAQMNLGGEAELPAPTPAELVALVDALRTGGALNEQQLNTLSAVRAGLVRLTLP